MQQGRKDLKWPTTKKKQLETAHNDLNITTTSKKKTQNDQQQAHFQVILQYGATFSSLTRFLPNIWLQSFEYWFTENNGENRASSIYYHAPSFNYHVYFLRDTWFNFFCFGFVSTGKGRGYFLAPLYHFHLLQKIVRSSPLVFIGQFHDE